MTLRIGSGNLIKVTVIMFIVSFYFFPIGFRGLPESLNTKQMLGVLGILLFVMGSLNRKSVSMPKFIVTAMFISIIFSCWCYYSTVVNNTSDYAYATHIVSFFVWLGGAFAVCEIIRLGHGYADLSLLTKYMVAVALMQCTVALLVRYVPAVQSFVDTFIIQDTMPVKTKRLYGLGCSLDSGGVRFCCIEALIAYQMVGNKEVLNNRGTLVFYLISGMIIGAVGSMIARTTSVGLVMSIAYILLMLGYGSKGILSKRLLRFIRTAFWTLATIVAVAVILYNSDSSMRRLIRFAFEAFFSLLEEGSLETGSTDILSTMWNWPTDTAGWIHGYGIFSTWGVFATDIGYCRFANYCGLVGLGIFSIFFMYCSYVVARKFDNAVMFALLLLALVFVIWIKVSTDIFTLFALLFCIDSRRLIESE